MLVSVANAVADPPFFFQLMRLLTQNEQINFLTNGSQAKVCHCPSGRRCSHEEQQQQQQQQQQQNINKQICLVSGSLKARSSTLNSALGSAFLTRLDPNREQASQRARPAFPSPVCEEAGEHPLPLCSCSYKHPSPSTIRASQRPVLCLPVSQLADNRGIVVIKRTLFVHLKSLLK